MLIARLLGYIRQAQTLHIFLLEILAVFIGITGSLFVDNWRSERAEHEVLNRLLQETHYNALQDESYLQRLMMFNEASLESSMALAYDDLDSISDADILRHTRYALAESWWLDLQPGYQRLLNTSVSIPFDNTIAELDWHFRNLIINIESMRDNNDRAKTAAIRLATLVGRPVDLSAANLQPGTDLAADRFAELARRMGTVPGYVEEINDANAVRSAMRLPAGREVIRELIGYHQNQHSVLISAAASVRMIIRAIRKYDPHITLPVGSIGIVGDATGLPVERNIAWTESIHMQPSPDDPNLWTIEIRLNDGELKFRADNDWSSDWGAPNRPEYTAGVELAATPFAFGGDASEVFPTGVAEFKGLNIPVTAGHYRVTFNSQTFAYSFERLPDP